MKKILLFAVPVVLLVSAVAPVRKKSWQVPCHPEREIKIGDTCFGGIVFWIAPLSQTGYKPAHGLVCSPVVQSGGIAWCRNKCYRINNLVTGVGMDSTGAALPGGRTNTDLIIAAYGNTNYAANMCKTLELNGYSDWFLPSRDELNLIYLNLKDAGRAYFANAYYWSSSESPGDTIHNNACAEFFGTGKQYNLSKNYSGYVRAVRAF